VKKQSLANKLKAQKRAPNCPREKAGRKKIDAMMAGVARHIKTYAELRRELTAGSDCYYAESLEIMEETGYTMPQLDQMPSSEADRLILAIIRKRRKRKAESLDPWKEIELDYKRKYPKATNRDVAGEILRRMDGMEQQERIQEFAKTKDYAGVIHRTAKDAAIAKIKKRLERLK
jgi:hypothetical protein